MLSQNNARLVLVFIGVVGLVAVPIIIGGTDSLLTFSLLAGFLFSLILSCFIVGLPQHSRGKSTLTFHALALQQQ